jgi:hypothetical protein
MALDTVSVVLGALFVGEPATDVLAADALITQALHLFSAKQLQKALLLVDQVGSRCSRCSRVRPP